MDEHNEVEEWADALLDRHRAAPRMSAARATPVRDSSSAVDDVITRLATKISGQPPDPEIWERVRRRRERFASLAKAEPVVTSIGIVVFCALAYAGFSPFT